MSKTSSKQRYVQLKEWLEIKGIKPAGSTNAPKRKFSKTDHYNKSR